MAAARVGAGWRVFDGAGWRIIQPAPRLRFVILDDIFEYKHRITDWIILAVANI